ncbi:GntR family transcriptional regulator [Cytobacillus firmus]|uniref:GntR family transcriptional regulator n=2 Tax=Cytobacillus TaxID=2675230 RepID=A0A366K3C5_CYTFI|nr:MULTISPECIES: GntR family transcriptional regulator [Cytobacillus]RBP95777.1 GntR family transcriptional regulator [Cytobacillus firmus]TDX44690.1 GntR family transcriptional regulator [Cytobacillus oceanisediminis]
MFELDVRSRKPIYEQLVERLKELIITEVLTADEQLPSVRTLAHQLTINPNTIQKAYRELESQGYIYSIKGKGSFISPATPNLNSEKIEKVKNELSKLLSEAIYLGITKDELFKMIQELEAAIGGGVEDDQNP